ncbi:MAG: trypsin-like peptidase domain-containing protein, partial [Clostridia bacterium]|nr:trypsin-like peptidase domain-containing protein [Clostridia bacterium]
LYNMYNNIDVNDSNYIAEKEKSTVQEQIVENTEKNSKSVADTIEETTKKIVGISKLKDAGTSIMSKSTESDLGLGTGIIVTDNGYILSNEHVTGSKYSICYVTLENGNNYEGTVVWSDTDLDLSITKINAKDLDYVTLGDSSTIRVGETVYAIGNPIGFEFRRTVTSGIISAKNRTIKIEEDNKSSYMTNLIQTDATINPGNSGGPLIYPNGEVIGINTVKISSAEGIGFAIPINIVKNITESYKNTGEFEEAKIGIYAYDKEVIPYINNKMSSLSKNLGVSTETNFREGIYVVEIIKNGSADNTELKVGDIITTIDNKELNTMNDLREYIYTKKASDTVVLQIKRGKIAKQISIILGK